MIETCTYYDLRQGIDPKEHQTWSKHVIEIILRAPGLVEYRASRNLGGSPQVRSTMVWKTLADWANFIESPEWQEINAGLRNNFAINISFAIWRPSPIVPKTLKAKK